MRRIEQIMGTAVSVWISDPLPAATLDRLATETFAWFRAVDERFSTYRADSEISRLGRGELSRAGCSPVVRQVLDRCATIGRATDGYFDIHATGQLDPSGYVKGWSVQVASDRLTAAGAANHCINAGGDVRVRGQREPGHPWRVGIRHPVEADKVAWVLSGMDLGVATSGSYERGGHVVDPHTGTAANELCSVTVLGPDLGLADAYATAAAAMGRVGLTWLAALTGYESAVVTEAGSAYRSGGLPVAPPADVRAGER